MRIVWVVVATALSACVQPDLVTCGDLACPTGDVCVARGCTTPQAAAACANVANGGECNLDSGPGTCDGGACIEVACGNGVRDHDEACDDGNAVYGDGCSADCLSNEVCGNGVVDPYRGEQCDRGVAHVSGDGCSSTCTTELRVWRDASPAAMTADRPVMVYDEHRHLTVLFGASAYTGDETWEWGGSGWLKRQPAHAPSPRRAHAMVYDPAGKRIVLFGGSDAAGNKLGDTWAYDGGDWTQLATAQSPPARDSAALGYDAARARIVLFGGATAMSSALGDTWEFDGANWIARSPTSSPSPRREAGIAYDAARGKLLMIGGSPANSDVWTYDGTTWTKLALAAPFMVSPASPLWDPGGQRVILPNPVGQMYAWNGTVWTAVPVGQALASMVAPGFAFDSARASVLTAGGANAGITTQATHEFLMSGTDWKDVTVPPSPSQRTNHGLAFDVDRARVVVFGGAGGSTLGDLWEWDGVNWQRRSTTGPARSAFAMAYDRKHHEMVIFGGGGTPKLGDTWLWNGTTFTQAHPATNPSARAAARAAWDPIGERVLMFGGVGAAPLDETWAWDGTNWEQLHPATSPGSLTLHTLVTDTVRGRVILYGGINSLADPDNRWNGDVWEWDGTAWTKASPPARPAARDVHSAAFDPLFGRMTVFGGDAATGSVSDAWDWDGAQWAPVDAVFSAPPTRSSAMAYDELSHAIVLFSGDGAIGAETWTLGFESSRPVERCNVATEDRDGDGLAGCDDPDCAARCTPGCLPGGLCAAAGSTCGDGTCDPAEDDLICPGDCAL